MGYRRVNNYPNHTGQYRCGNCKGWHHTDVSMVVVEVFGQVRRYCNEKCFQDFMTRRVVIMWQPSSSMQHLTLLLAAPAA